MLLIFQAVLVGGVVYAGVNTYRKRQQEQKTAWLDTPSNIQTASTTQTPDWEAEEERINRDFTVSSLSLGMSITGAIAYPPLAAASIPLTIYGSLPVFKESYEALFYKGRTKSSVVNSVVIIGTLATNQHTIAALVQWMHHLSQKLVVDFNYGYRQLLLFVFKRNAPAIWVVMDDVEVLVPRTELKRGDIVVVNEGEFIPVDGRIVEGTGLVDMYVVTGQARPIERLPGDKVFTATTLVSGRLCVKIDKM